VKNFKISLMLFALVLSPMSAFAATPWTGTPAAAVVDKSSPSGAWSDNTKLTFDATGSTGTILARMNVVSTTNSTSPGWTTMEIRGFDSSAAQDVQVKLFRASSGSVSAIAQCDTSDSGSVQTVTCGLSSSVDFSTNNYWIEIRVGRSSTSGTAPFLQSVRIY
jgi:hypothetical protein